MNLLSHIKFALSRPPRNQIKFVVTTFIGNKISQRFYGKSLVGNFLQMIYVQLAYADTTDFPVSGAPWSSATSCKDIGNTLRATFSSNYMRCNADPGSVTNGLILGTGSTAVTASDYKIETIIPHGNSANQLNYQNQGAQQGCEITDLTTAFILQRLFVNNSGGQIDVREIALYSFLNYSFCLYRDVLPVVDEVPNTETYRVTLEISITS